MPSIVALEEKNLPSTCLIFKHSTACPVSGTAAAEVRNAELPHALYWINVIEQRDLSNWVSEHFGVEHQSPQLLLIRDGKPDGSWSHSAIQKSLIEGLS